LSRDIRWSRKNFCQTNCNSDVRRRRRWTADEMDSCIHSSKGWVAMESLERRREFLCTSRWRTQEFLSSHLLKCRRQDGRELALLGVYDGVRDICFESSHVKQRKCNESKLGIQPFPRGRYGGRLINKLVPLRDISQMKMRIGQRKASRQTK
jgi:hypothetical protein